jgi:hypothetical protein
MHARQPETSQTAAVKTAEEIQTTHIGAVQTKKTNWHHQKAQEEISPTTGAISHPPPIYSIYKLIFDYHTPVVDIIRDLV